MPTKRVPITGVYNTRPGSVTVSSSSSIVGVGVVGQMVLGSVGFASTKDARFINCFPITQSDRNANSKRLQIVNRAGFDTFITPAAGATGSALQVWTGQGAGQKVMSCFGATNSTLYDGTTSKGSATGVARGIQESNISGTPTLFMASSDSTGWTYQDGGSVTQISDSDFPGNASRTTVGNFAMLDGYPFVMDSTGRVYNGDLNSVTAWTGNSYFAANSIPDVGIGVHRHRDTLIAFGKEHLEVLYNAGNPTGTPLQRINERTQKIGCTSAEAIAEIRDKTYFAGMTRGVNVGIYSYDGGQIQKISTPEIEWKLTYAGPSNITLTTLGEYGRHFVVVCASLQTYVYCVEEEHWSEWSGTQLWHRASGVSTGSTIVNYALSKTSTAGKIFAINPLSVTYQDNGSTFTSTIQTANFDLGTDKRKVIHRIGFIGDRGTTISVQWYDDDYGTLSSARTVNMSLAKPSLFRCGSFRRRAFVISHAANASMRLEALEFDYEECDA
jgi:hypothetical protein